MKINFFYCTAMASLFLLVSSCSNEDVLTKNNKTMSFTAEEYLTITYDGKTYESIPTAYDAEGNFVFLDEEFASLYNNEVALFSELSTLIVGNNEIEFYKNLNTLLEEKELTLLEGEQVGKIQLRSGVLPGYNFLATLKLHDDKSFKDRFVTDTLTLTKIAKENTNLKDSPHKFNDKCSSLIITNNLPNSSKETIKLGAYTYACSDVIAVFIGYDDRNFTDRSIVCIATAGEEKKESSLSGFNDKLSSYKFLFAQKGQYTARW